MCGFTFIFILLIKWLLQYALDIYKFKYTTFIYLCLRYGPIYLKQGALKMENLLRLPHFLQPVP